MATKLHYVEKRDGMASIIVGVFVTVVLLLVGVALTTYNQFVAGRQVVTTTATGALRSAVPAGFVTETVATSKSQHAYGLVVDPAAYDVAVGQALPSFWSGARAQLCTTTPQGSPVTCTPGSSFLVTLPTVTAQDLHIAGPLVVANIQLVTSPPYKVTHFGHTTTLAQPAVAADVTYPVDIAIMGLNFHVWAEQAITNSLYADQGGSTGGSSRYLAFGSLVASPPPTGSSGSSSQGICWEWPDSTNPACATEPPWCGGTATTSCTLSPGGSSWLGGTTGLSVGFYNPTQGGHVTTTLGSSVVGTLPWEAPPSNRCWVETSADHYALTGTPGSSSCTTLSGTVPSWATTITVGTVFAGYPPSSKNTPCYGGSLPGSSVSSPSVTGYFCGNYSSGSGSGSGGGSGVPPCYAYAVSPSGVKQCIGN